MARDLIFVSLLQSQVAATLPWLVYTILAKHIAALLGGGALDAMSSSAEIGTYDAKRLASGTGSQRQPAPERRSDGGPFGLV